MNQPQIGTGVVRHRRLRPQGHAFAYPTYFLMLPMRTLRTAPATALARNRFGLLSFHDRDHGDGRADALAWLDDLLLSEKILDATGEVWLHCYPRVLGYAFKPVSFWHCQRDDGTLAAVVVEVNNTFGERHCYLLAGPGRVWPTAASCRRRRSSTSRRSAPCRAPTAFASCTPPAARWRVWTTTTTPVRCCRRAYRAIWRHSHQAPCGRRFSAIR